MKKKNKIITRLFSVVTMVCMLFGLMPNQVYAADESGYRADTTFNKHAKGNENISIAEYDADGNILWKNIAYCYNYQMGFPYEKPEQDFEIKNNKYELANGDWNSLTNTKDHTEDLKDILTKIVFIGYPCDSNDRNNTIRNIIKNECKVSDEYVDDVFRAATQKAVWRATDNKRFTLSSSTPTGDTNALVSTYIGEIIYEKATKCTNVTGVETRLWQTSPLNNRIQNLLEPVLVKNPDTDPKDPDPEKTEVFISKTDIAGDVLKGATLVVKNEKDEEVFRQENSDGTEEISVIPGTYTLIEEAAPNGYQIAESIQFVVDNDGKVTVAGNEVENVVMVDKFADQTVKISKINNGGEEIEGAKLKITDEEDNVVDEWTSEAGKSHQASLEPGAYTLTEVSAPNGYTIANPVSFTVSLDSNGDAVVMVNREIVNTVVMVDEKVEPTQEKCKIKFSKQDINGNELKGATITLKGTNFEETWVTDGQVKEFELPVGVYGFVEVEAPKGYEKATPNKFSIDTDHTVTIGKETKRWGDEIVYTMVDIYSKQDIVISKVDVGGHEIEGAKLTVTGKDTQGYEIDPIEWVSEKNKNHTISVQPGTYTLTEKTAPNGYEKAESITFTVSLDQDGNAVVTVDGKEVNEVVMVDKYADQTVKIKKTDMAGEVLKGATLIVKDKDGKEVFKQVNSDGTEEIKVQPGTYTLIEETAPDGYTVAESIVFAVDKDGKVTVGGNNVDEVVMKDKKTVVKISKVDIANGKELAGAQMQILDKDGKLVTKWLSTKEVHVVKGLKTGVPYTLKEKVAPDGYNITANTTFVLKADGTIDTSKTTTKVKDGILLVEDSKKSNVTTGADNGMKLYASIAGAALIVIVAIVVSRKKKKQ